MTYAERKALAAKRLANPALYFQQPTQPQQPTQQMSEAAEARLIDRGLIAWWN